MGYDRLSSVRRYGKCKKGERAFSRSISLILSRKLFDVALFFRFYRDVYVKGERLNVLAWMSATQYNYVGVNDVCDGFIGRSEFCAHNGGFYFTNFECLF